MFWVGFFCSQPTEVYLITTLKFKKNCMCVVINQPADPCCYLTLILDAETTQVWYAVQHGSLTNTLNFFVIVTNEKTCIEYFRTTRWPNGVISDCRSDLIIKYGGFLQRYKCKKCNTTFNDLNGLFPDVSIQMVYSHLAFVQDCTSTKAISKKLQVTYNPPDHLWRPEI